MYTSSLFSSALVLIAGFSTAAQAVALPAPDQNGIVPLWEIPADVSTNSTTTSISSTTVSTSKSSTSAISTSRISTSTSSTSTVSTSTVSTSIPQPGNATVVKRCKNMRVRKEWRRLTNPEKLNYLDAVNCLHSLPGKSTSKYPGVRNRYDDYVALHITITNGTIPIHNNGLFLPWHRWTVWLYETALINECNYTGTQPFWDYYLDGPAHNRHLNQSPIWDAKYGLGGNGKVDPSRMAASSIWGVEDVHPPGFNVWGDGDVVPPIEGDLTANVGSTDGFGSPRPKPAELSADIWGKEDPAVANAPDLSANLSQSSLQPALTPSEPALVSVDDAWGHRRFPLLDAQGNFLDPDKPEDVRRAKHDRRSQPYKRQLYKRQQITAKAGPAGKGMTPLNMGGPAWPFIQFYPLVPPFLVDGLLRPDGDDNASDNGADANDDDRGASEYRGPVGCVSDGPFANWTAHLGPGVDMVGTPRCVKRAFEFTKAEETLTEVRMKETFGRDTYAKFMDLDEMKGINMGPHTNGHRGIGGDMANLYSSTNDPVFFLHHAYIDRLWTLWQGNNATRLHDIDSPYEGMPPPADGVNPPTGRVTKDSDIWFGMMGADRKVSSVMDAVNREGDPDNELCYTYDDFGWQP